MNASKDKPVWLADAGIKILDGVIGLVLTDDRGQATTYVMVGVAAAALADLLRDAADQVGDAPTGLDVVVEVQDTSPGKGGVA